LEDLVMAVYLPILTAALAGVSFWGGFRAVGVALLAVTLVLLLALRYGPQISRLVHSPDQENFLLKLIGAALLVAGLAAALQVSAAVGAFLLGIAISGSTAHSAAKVLAPLRDLFAAMFFVLFGINTDPATIPPVLVLALALALVTSVTKVLTGVWAARRAGIGVPGRIRAGTALIARGEFSIVIAGLAVAGGGASPELAALATAYVMLLAVLGPIATKLAEPVARALTGRPGRSPQRAGHD
ncbi:MAG: cation:proton antiporter, partial [Micrococcaceae bacterium]|nr:cation:proton antiporter [Micrococcaceae bacterium]